MIRVHHDGGYLLVTRVRVGEEVRTQSNWYVGELT